MLYPDAQWRTNALALRPPTAIALRFGRNSAEAHRRGAIEVGIEPVLLDLPRLRFDVDSPDDLSALESSPTGAATKGWLDARAQERAERPGAGR